MKLSVNILFSALKEVFPQTTLCKKRKSDNDLSLPYPHYYDNTFAFLPNQIYVVSAEHIPSDFTCDGPCLLIVPELYSKLYYHKNIAVIIVAGVDVPALFNQVLTIFNQYSEWDNDLQNLVFRNAPLVEYLRCSFPFIGNAMSIHNSNFTYLAKFGESPEVSAQSHKREFFDPDFLLRVNAQSNQSVFYSKKVIRFREENSRYEYCFLNLFNGNTAAGRLVVTNNRRPFTAQDSVLIQHLGKYLEAALSYAAFTGSGRNLRRDSLLDYLNGKPHSDDKIMHLKTVSPFSKLKEDQRLYCLVGVCQDSDVPEQYLVYQLERALPESVCVLFDSKIVFLCANEPKQTPETLFSGVRLLLEELSITAGCSNPFTDFFDLKYCYREAEFALLLMNDKPGYLHHFKDHTLEHFLRYGCSILPMRLICAECVVKLAEHDANAAVSYCDSLRAYLDTGMNSAETARQLNITRNTFLARLERIMRYVDLDLNDQDSKLYLQISLQLIQHQSFFNARYE